MRSSDLKRRMNNFRDAVNAFSATELENQNCIIAKQSIVGIRAKRRQMPCYLNRDSLT